jgi:tetratricopeptide (TPR) repeat protein
MGFNADWPAPKEKAQGGGQIAAAIAYLRQGFAAQAFLLLSGQQTEKDPAARFALGLCHLRAGEAEAAISCFEQALGLLKALPGPAPSPIENSAMYLTLAQKQIETQFYLTPIDADFCLRFPKFAGQMVLLALISVYRQKGMSDQAQKLAAGLTGPAFEAYKINLRQEDSHGIL